MENNILEIDFVYLWVDGSDPVWRAKRDSFLGISHVDTSVNCEGRYIDNDELKYSLRSLEKYAPWIRNIFIVTDNQVPKWLDTSNPKIHIVDHTEILPTESLPCFSSTLIEHFLWKIPGLSEHFLYGNDDMFLNKPATPASFFDANGLPIVRLNRRRFRKLSLLYKEKIKKQKLSYYVQSIKLAANMVEKRHGAYFGGQPHHNIDAYLKSDYQHTHETFKQEIDATLGNNVRKSGDIQRSIYSYAPLAKKRGRVRYINRKESFKISIHLDIHFTKFKKYTPLFFCLNDTELANSNHRNRATNFLKKRFPEKSQFEK